MFEYLLTNALYSDRVSNLNKSVLLVLIRIFLLISEGYLYSLKFYLSSYIFFLQYNNGSIAFKWSKNFNILKAKMQLNISEGDQDPSGTRRKWTYRKIVFKFLFCAISTNTISPFIKVSEFFWNFYIFLDICIL